MKRIVIESPYAGDIVRNTKYAKRCMKHSLSLGEYPIASHLLYTQKGILNDNIQEERTLGIAAGIVWAELSEKAVFYLDIGLSDGMIGAMRYYASVKKPIEIRYIDKQKK